MVALGTAMPSFELPDTNGAGVVTSQGLMSRDVVLVMFLCNHCPFVKHVRSQVAAIGREYASRGVAIAGISSNDAQQYPDDAPEKMTVEAREAGYTFAYLYDKTQEVAKAFGATCTPDFFVYAKRDGRHELVYRGQLDDSRPAKYLDGKEIAVTGADLRAALDAALAGRSVSQTQYPSMGCNIKWKPGHEPMATV
jgi:peroxiredoxin